MTSSHDLLHLSGSWPFKGRGNHTRIRTVLITIDVCLATCKLDGVPLFLQFSLDSIPVIPLDLDYTVFQRTATAAQFFQALSNEFQFIGIDRNPRNGSHTLAFAALCFAPNPNNAVYGRYNRDPCLVLRLDAPGFGRINKPGISSH